MEPQSSCLVIGVHASNSTSSNHILVFKPFWQNETEIAPAVSQGMILVIYFVFGVVGILCQSFSLTVRIDLLGYSGASYNYRRKRCGAWWGVIDVGGSSANCLPMALLVEIAPESRVELSTAFHVGITGFAKRILGIIVQESTILTRFVSFGLAALAKLVPECVPDVQGSRMYLLKGDSISFLISIMGIWEPAETEIVKRIVRRGDVALDIGAHIGYYTLILSKLVGQEGLVYAFEPSEKNYAILKKNVEVNGCKNVVLVNKAVSDTTGKAMLDGWSVQGIGIPARTNSQRKGLIEIDAIRLDDFFAECHCEVNFIKIDVEGHEYRALSGGSDLLRRSENMSIMSELAPAAMSAMGSAPSDYLDFLIRHDFRVWYLDLRKDKLLPVEDASRLVDQYGDWGKGVALVCSKDRKC